MIGAHLEIDGILSVWDCVNGGYLAQYEDMQVHLVVQAYLAKQKASKNKGVKYLPSLPLPPENYESEGSLFVYPIDGGGVIATYEDGILVHKIMTAFDELKNGRLPEDAAQALFGNVCLCDPYYCPTEHEKWCLACAG